MSLAEQGINFEVFRDMKRAVGVSDADIKIQYFGEEDIKSKVANYADQKARERQNEVKQSISTRLAEMGKERARRDLYIPDFRQSDEYKKIAEQDISMLTQAERDKMQRDLLHISLHGNITDNQKQEVIDHALELPLVDLIKEKAKYQKEMKEAEEKIDSDPDGDAEHLSKLKIKRYEAGIYLGLCEDVLKDFVSRNRSMIEAEVEEARRREIRGSLADLLDYLD